MGRHQCKNTFNNLKRDMITPEHSGHMARGFEHLIAGETEEKDFKYNFLKIIDIHQEEVKKILKEMNIFVKVSM